MKKYVLTILASLPIKSIAVASRSELQKQFEINQSKIFIENVRNARMSILPENISYSTMEDAKLRIKEISNLESEDEIEAELIKNLILLKINGIIDFNDAEIVSAAPSWIKI